MRGRRNLRVNKQLFAKRLVWLSLSVAACSSSNTEPAELAETSGNSSTGSVTGTSGSGASSTSVGQGNGSAGGPSTANTSGNAGSAASSTTASGSAGTTAASSDAGSTAPAAGSGAVSTGSAGTAAGSGSSAGAGSAANSGTAGAAAGSSGSSVDPTTLDKFSFFATSFAGLQRLSGSENGFGGDLRYGETDGLSGADKICSELAEASMEGASAKGWHAFLSVSAGPEGTQVDAIDRIGEGPWYDRLGRVFAMDKAALLNARPKGADPTIINDFPNEDGVPNQTPDPSAGPVNNHHFLTGSDTSGKLYGDSSTCDDWTSADRGAGRPRIGFSYPAGNRQHWISGQDEGGCGAGAVLVDRGGSDPSNPIVGSGGGYGGFYCFATTP